MCAPEIAAPVAASVILPVMLPVPNGVAVGVGAGVLVAVAVGVGPTVGVPTGVVVGVGVGLAPMAVTRMLSNADWLRVFSPMLPLENVRSVTVASVTPLMLALIVVPFIVSV